MLGDTARPAFVLPQPLRALGERRDFVFHDVRRIGPDVRLTLATCGGFDLMFTGIVQGVGTVRAIEPRGGDVTIVLDTGSVDLAGIELGGSIAVSGVCLTATRFDRSSFAADVSRETLSLTTLGECRVGTRVNLEKALARGPGARRPLRDGTRRRRGRGRLAARDARSVRMEFRVPPELARYVARKGSICIDGVSLTVNGAQGDRFDVNLVPHTLRGHDARAAAGRQPREPRGRHHRALRRTDDAPGRAVIDPLRAGRTLLNCAPRDTVRAAATVRNMLL